jgi:hypothetical protein
VCTALIPQTGYQATLTSLVLLSLSLSGLDFCAGKSCILLRRKRRKKLRIARTYTTKKIVTGLWVDTGVRKKHVHITLFLKIFLFARVIKGHGGKPLYVLHKNFKGFD